MKEGITEKVNAGIAKVGKRCVMSAPAKSVQPVDHHDVEIRHVPVGHSIDVAGELARDAVDVAARPPLATQQTE